MFSTIGKRLILLILVPLMVLSSFSLLLLWQNYSQYEKAKTTRQLMEVAIATGNLIHTLQIERGASAGFLQSHGKNFADKLPGIRLATEARLQAYRQAVSGNPILVGIQSVQAAKAELQQLTALRGLISQQGTSAAQSSAYFSRTIATLLKSISTIGMENDQADIVRRLQAYLTLIQAKENAGLERALSVPVFIADKAEWPQYRAIMAKIDSQAELMHQFESLAQPDEAASLERVLASPESKRVAQFRSVMESRFAQGGFNVAAEQWFDAITAKINALYGVEQQLTGSIEDQTRTQENLALRNLWLVVVAGAVTVLLTAGVGLWVGRSIGWPLLSVARTVEEAVAERDLSRKVHADGVQEARQIGRAFNHMLESFSSLILEVQGSGRDMGSVATQLSASSNQVKRSASVQSEAASSVASAVEESSVSMTEMAASARTVMEQVQHSRTETGQALATMHETVQKVHEIANQIETSSHDINLLNESSKQIGSIVNVIKGIAEQTNLLALNAAIEAARAGEMGRGFAVVADEVRNLAARTGTATEEIAGLIQVVQQRIDASVAGMSQADRLSRMSLDSVSTSEQGLQMIDEGSQRISQHMQTIAEAIEEQDKAMQAITRSIEQIAQMTEENNVVAVHNNSHAEKIDHLAERLLATINQYRISAS